MLKNLPAMQETSQEMWVRGGGHGNPLQYCCLTNPLDRRAWWAVVYRVTKSQTQLKLTDHTRVEGKGHSCSSEFSTSV